MATSQRKSMQLGLCDQIFHLEIIEFNDIELVQKLPPPT